MNITELATANRLVEKIAQDRRVLKAVDQGLTLKVGANGQDYTITLAPSVMLELAGRIKASLEAEIVQLERHLAEMGVNIE